MAKVKIHAEVFLKKKAKIGIEPQTKSANR
jgi:hypothetical protein